MRLCVDPFSFVSSPSYVALLFSLPPHNTRTRRRKRTRERERERDSRVLDRGDLPVDITIHIGRPVTTYLFFLPWKPPRDSSALRTGGCVTCAAPPRSWSLGNKKTMLSPGIRCLVNGMFSRNLVSPPYMSAEFVTSKYSLGENI